MNIEVSKTMITAGVDASLLYRGDDADSEEFVSEIYRAMESVRQIHREASVADDQES